MKDVGNGGKIEAASSEVKGLEIHKIHYCD